MNNYNPLLIKDFQPLTKHHYDVYLAHYVSYTSQFPFVKAIYQLGSVGQPGLSDLDVIVVVDDVVDPLAMNKLSVFQSQKDPLFRYLFIHDIYLFNESSFKQIHYIHYSNRLQLLYGNDLLNPEYEPAHGQPLSIQIVFDFISSRLIQFENFLASPKLGLRGLLVRVSSLRHSYFLLKQCGIQDKETEQFIEKINDFRASIPNGSAEDIWQLFLQSFHYFRRIVLLAADFFENKYLLYQSPVAKSSFLQLNAQFGLRFTSNYDIQKSIDSQCKEIEYPAAVFYHYLGYCKGNSLVAEAARASLAYTGEEVFALSSEYEEALLRRAHAVSAHRAFLAANRAQFAMGGHVGFEVGWQQALIEGPLKYGPWMEKSYEPQTRVKKFNLIIDQFTVSKSFEMLTDQLGTHVIQKDYSAEAYEAWVDRFFPDWPERWGHRHYKKFVELYASYQLLEIERTDIVMDVAGGHDTYIDQLNCQRKYIQNIEVNEVLKDKLKTGVEFIEGDAAQIPLPKASVDKMACHHSFEHFQGDSDTRLVQEIQRLLAPGGRCVIVPIFIGNHFVEVTQQKKPYCHYDQNSQYIVDPTARITGGETCGDYARIYDVQSFKRRILDHVDLEAFEVEIVEILIGGQPTPNPHLLSHLEITGINLPYRALVLKKTK